LDAPPSSSKKEGQSEGDRLLGKRIEGQKTMTILQLYCKTQKNSRIHSSTIMKPRNRRTLTTTTSLKNRVQIPSWVSKCT
ncbi:hypothetical protein GN956_G25700, partial [Arapaima gigas]